jgi:hypothetical protein
MYGHGHAYPWIARGVIGTWRVCPDAASAAFTPNAPADIAPTDFVAPSMNSFLVNRPLMMAPVCSRETPVVSNGDLA